MYDASARCQSPPNMRCRVRRYFAAALVAFSGSARSSTYQSCFSPFSSPVGRMNCQNPLADTRETADALKALSISGT